MTKALAVLQPENSIINFGENADLREKDMRLALLDAAAFIYKRKQAKGRLMGEIIRLTIEEGFALEWVYESMKRTGESFEAWVKPNTGYDADTARNYRNLAKRFAELVQQTPSGVLDRMQAGALYKLAVETVPVEAGVWYFNKMLENPQLKGDEKLAAIAKDPEIRQRFDDHELTKEQAYALAQALPKCNEFIQALCREMKVQEAGVALWLHNVYLDYCKTPDNKRPDKTWAELKHNEFYLLWGQTNRVHISTAHPSDCSLYMQARAQGHKNGLIGVENGGKDEPNAVQPFTSRATFEIRRIAGVLCLVPLDTTLLPPNAENGTILGDLLLETLQNK